MFYLFAAKLCNALPECRDKGPAGVAQVGVELLLVMGRQMGPPTAQPEKQKRDCSEENVGNDTWPNKFSFLQW